MQLTCPQALFARRVDATFEQRKDALSFLDAARPNVVVNLAGENRVDVVQGAPQQTAAINCGLPMWAAEWCDDHDAHLIQVSSQGVFSGDHAPYGPASVPHPRTEYGAQKVEAEQRVAKYRNWTIARVTFVLGVRPLDQGRVNPLEQMFELSEQRQVNDRWFSPSFAIDVAHALTLLTRLRPVGDIVHLGLPVRVSRYDIAKIANPDADIQPVGDDTFSGPSRPIDTSYAPGCLWVQTLTDGIDSAREQWKAKNVPSQPGRTSQRDRGLPGL